MAFHAADRHTVSLHFRVSHHLSARAQLLPVAAAHIPRHTRKCSGSLGRRQSSGSGRNLRRRIPSLPLHTAVSVHVGAQRACQLVSGRRRSAVCAPPQGALSLGLPAKVKYRKRAAIRALNGQTILMRQVAGALARRIVTYASPGEDASIEEHMGFIKFGSRVDLYLPLGTEILVKLGDTTTGGVTEVARLK